MMTKRLQLPARHKLSLVTLALLGCAPAFAAEPPGWYAGASVGATRSHFDDPTTASIRPYVGSGFTAGASTEDDKDKGWKLYGGYRLSRNFAIEGGYFDLGRFDYRVNTTPAGTFGGELRARGLNLDLVGILPIGERFSVFGRVGAAYTESRSNFNRTGAVLLLSSSEKDRYTRAKFGVGMQYAFTERLSVRAEVERYRVEDPVRSRSNIDMASVGLVYYFGAQPRPVAAAPAPIYVAPPPPPPPASASGDRVTAAPAASGSGGTAATPAAPTAAAARATLEAGQARA